MVFRLSLDRTRWKGGKRRSTLKLTHWVHGTNPSTSERKWGSDLEKAGDALVAMEDYS